MRCAMRSHYCGLIGQAEVGAKVTLCGWADARRDHGGVVFIDLRDHAGIVQVVADPDHAALFASLDPVATVRDRSGRTELLLVAGPFKSAADASEHCGKVEAAGLICQPAFYLGQPLAMR